MKEVFYREHSKSDKDVFDYNPMSMSIFSNVGDLKGQPFRYFTFNGYEGYETRDPEDWDWAEGIYSHFLNQDKRNWFVVNGMTPILCEIPFAEEDIQKLRNGPVAFYMYESLSFSAHEGRCFELDRITEFQKKYDLKNQVYVYTCEYHYEDYANDYAVYDNLNIRTFDLYLAHCSTFRPYTAFQACTLPKPLKKFICLNYRYEPFREILAGFLSSYENEELAHLSFYHSHKWERFIERLNFNWEDLERKDQVLKGIRSMQTNLPLSPDASSLKVVDPDVTSAPDMGTDANLRGENEIYSYYNSSLVAIVPETSFFLPAAGLSEKTMSAIEAKRPFIVVSGPYALEYLRDLGFETFSDFWDESYDQETDPVRRMNKILDLIDSLATKPMESLKSMYNDMAEVLEYNARVWLELFEERRLNYIREQSEEVGQP